MVPGRRYNVRYLIRTLRASWWLLVVPVAITGSIAVMLARTLPDVYFTRGIIQIVPPRLPANYVKGGVTLSTAERVQAARAQVLNPQQLQSMINEFDIYATVRHRVPSDVVLSWFRSSVRIELVRADLFTVGFYGYSRTRVEQVAQRLTALMLQEMLKQRETVSDNTEQFLETQLEDARRRLEEQERKVSDYRRRYSGQLPTQVDANLRMLQTASSELQAIDEALGRDHQRRDELARQLAAAAAAAPPAVPDDTTIEDPPPGNPTATLPAGPPARQLRAAKALRARLLRRFTSEHPDMQALDRSIAELEAAAATSPTSDSDAPAVPASQLQTALTALDTQIATREATAKRLREAVSSYRGRVDAVPAREAEWMALTRDYTTLQGVYANLNAKREESRLAASVDRQAVGERVHVVEQPRRPNAPISPNRRAVVMIGAGLGLGLGLALFVGRELRDKTIRAEEEVLAALNLPVVGLVPRIVTALDRRQLRRRRILWTAAALALGVGLAAVQWVR